MEREADISRLEWKQECCRGRKAVRYTHAHSITFSHFKLSRSSFFTSHLSFEVIVGDAKEEAKTVNWSQTEYESLKRVFDKLKMTIFKENPFSSPAGECEGRGERERGERERERKKESVCARNITFPRTF